MVSANYLARDAHSRALLDDAINVLDWKGETSNAAGDTYSLIANIKTNQRFVGSDDTRNPPDYAKQSLLHHFTN